MRPDWDEYFMGIATQVASRATCLRKKVGSVLARDRTVLSCGYNGSPIGQPHCTDDGVGCEMEDGHCVRTVHAEINTVSQAARNGASISGATIYTTASPCYPCSKVLVNAGVKRVVFGEQYRKDERCDKLFSQAGIEVSFLVTPRESVVQATVENLASDENWNVRKAVAENPATPPAVLEKLASDEDSSVRYAVATNPATPKAVLEKLASDKDRYVRYAVATNPATPKAVLEKLASDEDSSVRNAVATNPATPKAVLERLASDANEGVREAVAGNPATPQAVLEKLAGDEDSSVREAAYYAAHNPADRGEE